jgi:hypothetical protein
MIESMNKEESKGKVNGRKGQEAEGRKRKLRERKKEESGRNKGIKGRRKEEKSIEKEAGGRWNI